MNSNIPDYEDPRIEAGAVNVYQSEADAVEEFPVLKAFQQYIDSEQSKARKRMLLLCLFFSMILTIVVGVFVFLLVASSARNQALNDRLVDYAMKERLTAVQQVAPQTPQHQDDSAVRALKKQVAELQAEIVSARERTEQKAAEEAQKKTRELSAESQEIERLKALLAIEKEKASAEREKALAEREKAAAEREKQRQAELEAYRRKHYPELYGLKPSTPSAETSASRKKARSEEDEEADREIESILRDIKPIDYFDDDEENSEEKPRARKSKPAAAESSDAKPVAKPADDDDELEVKPMADRGSAKKEGVPPSKEDAAAPGEVKDKLGNAWDIPLE